MFLSFIGSAVFAQTESESCYEKYREVFENRGAYDAEDGNHENVILSTRAKDGTTECIMSSAVIQNGEIVKVLVIYEDETKDIMEFDFKDNVSWTVFNGMSRTRVTKQNQQIDLMFTDLIKPKKKKLKKAPLPDFDLND